MIYKYVAYEGRRRRVGTLDAESETDVVRAINHMGWFLVSVKETKPPKQYKPVISLSVGRTQLAFLFRQLAAVVRMGLPVTRALAMQAEHMTGTWKRVLTDIETRVRGGESLADAMAAYPKIFQPVFIELIRAGEQSGTADEAFERCANYIEASANLKQKVRSAMSYPLVILIMALVGGSYLVIAVLPKITDMLIQVGVPLPLATRLLIRLSDFMKTKWMFVAGGAVGFIVLLPILLQLRPVRVATDWLGLKIPAINKVIRGSVTSRSLRVLAESLSVGLPVKLALELSAKSAGNLVMEHKLFSVIPRAVSGSGLAAALEESRAFPYIVPQVVRMGEETGSVPKVLKDLATFYEQQADDAVKAMTSLIEPLLIVTVALVIGFIAMAIIMPIYQMMGQLGG